MKSNDFLSEGIAEDAHEMHLDHEVQMAREECYHAAESAIVLHRLLRHVSETQGLEGWVSAKITLANDYLKTVREYLEYELMTGHVTGPGQPGHPLPIAESTEKSNPVVSAVTGRILRQRPDLLQKYGPVKIMQAIDEVGNYVNIGPDDEIGTSDVSGWVRQVEQMLATMPNDIAEAQPAYNPANLAKWKETVLKYYPAAQFMTEKRMNGQTIAKDAGQTVGVYDPMNGVIKIVPPATGSGVAAGSVMEADPMNTYRQRVQSQGFTDSPAERNADRLARKRRHNEKLDKMHADFMAGNVGLYGKDEKEHQAQQRMARDAARTQKEIGLSGEADSDYDKTADMLRDRINRHQRSSQKDVNPEQLKKITDIKYTPTKESAEEAGAPPVFYTKCKTCGTPYNKHFRFDANGKILSSLVRHPTMKDDFPGMDGMQRGQTRPRPINPQQGVAEGVAETLPMSDAVKVLKHYGAEHFKTTSNELHFYKNGRGLSVDLVWNDDATRSVTLSSLNSATRKLKGQGLSEVHDPDDYDICSACNGSGEGMYDGSTCFKCHGSGEQAPEERDDDFDIPDDDMDDNEPESHYEKYVRTNNLESRKSGIAQGISETNAGSVAGVVNPTPKNKAKVGSLFGGTYKQKKAAK